MPIKTIYTDRLSLGHNSSEIYIKGDDFVIILPPSAAKKLLLDLQRQNFPDDPPAVKKTERQESVPRKIIKALYKSRKLTKSLVSVNTGRRKKLPDR